MSLEDRITSRPFGYNTALSDHRFGVGRAGFQFRQQSAEYGRALRLLNRQARRGDAGSAIEAIKVREDAQNHGFSPGGITKDGELDRMVSDRIGTMQQGGEDARQSGILSRLQTQRNIHSLTSGSSPTVTPATPSLTTPASPATTTLGGGGAAPVTSGVSSPGAPSAPNPATAAGSSLAGMGLTSSIPFLNTESAPPQPVGSSPTPPVAPSQVAPVVHHSRINGMPAAEAIAKVTADADAIRDAPTPEQTQNTLLDRYERAKARYRNTMAGNGSDEDHKAATDDLMALSKEMATKPGKAPESTQGTYKGSDSSIIDRHDRAWAKYQAAIAAGEDPDAAKREMDGIYRGGNSLDQARLSGANLVKQTNILKRQQEQLAQR
jgi:hypothetical protein